MLLHSLTKVVIRKKQVTVLACIQEDVHPPLRRAQWPGNGLNVSALITFEYIVVKTILRLFLFNVFNAVIKICSKVYSKCTG